MRSHLADLDLDALLRRAARLWPDRPAMVTDSGVWTWAALQADVDAWVAAWRGAGVRTGDPVAVACEKRPAVVIAFLACARLGAIYVPVNHKLPLEQVQDAVASMSVAVLVHDVRWEALARALRPLVRVALPLSPEGDAAPGAASNVGLLPEASRGTLPREARGVAGPTAPPQEPHGDPDHACYYNLTSGSTGRSKGAVTTSRHIVANAIATADGLGFGADEVYLGMFSVFAHPHELFHRSILDGSAFVLTDSLSPRILAETVRRFGVTWMMAVPSFYEMLLDHLVATGEHLPSLRVLEAGGAWVGPDALARMERGFGATFLPVWGSTETTGVGLGLPVGAVRPAGAVGRAMPGYAVRLVREDGAEAAVDEVGELVVAGPGVVSAYVNVPVDGSAEAPPFAGGAYRTGDLFRRDSEGMYHFVARRSEMLKIGGIRVYPLEIETALAAHPDVRAVAVVRAEDRIRGEVARAVVELQPGATMSVRAAQAWCRARLAAYKVPRIVEFREALPRLPNGKLDRKAIASVAANANPAT